MNPIYRVPPRLVTVAGCMKLRTLIKRAQSLNGYSLDDLVDKIFTINGEAYFSKTTLHRALNGDRELPELFIEMVASSGLLAPSTRDEVWAIAWGLEPATRKDDPLVPVESVIAEMQRSIANLYALADVRQPVPLVVPRIPKTRAEAMAELAGAFRRTHPGRSALQISAYLQRCDYCAFPPEKIENILMERTLLTHEECAALSFEENRLLSEDGSRYDHAYVVRYFTEGGWTALGTRASGSPASLAQG